MPTPPSRRDLIRHAAAAAAVLALPFPLSACARKDATIESAADQPPPAPATGPATDDERLALWVAALRTQGLATPDASLGRAAARVGELAAGTPYVAGALDAYIKAGGDPTAEPLEVSLTSFDCVTLVESCLALARVAAAEGEPTWERFGQEIERMRYRGGVRTGYASRLHYFSEWISDGAKRGLVRDLGAELGGEKDNRLLRFMSEHRSRYPASATAAEWQKVREMERTLDASPRLVVPTERIPEIQGRIETGDVLAFATSIVGLDVTHAAFAYRGDDGVLRVLHAPLSGGVVEVTGSALPEYVAAIGRSTGILVARPLWA
ncbi:MAG TPA: N-acetylmuramoyl-L-alanine amidase-like domain-containing protein [Gemmatimonadales bacterium]|nr:N-acetylmuramoyl-L-alanine amidase-like domain-containing protein [Gemmatimonadales bacterium]